MFQCIIQQKNGWIHAPTPDQKDVFPDIRVQLNEQLKWLDARVEAQAALAGELQDYCRRRADVEADYSRGLDKLARTLQLRHKEHKHKHEQQWHLLSAYSCWQQLVGATRALARDHAALADLYSTRLALRLHAVAEDVQRVYRKCREIGYETHEEILRVLGELHAAMKTHQAYAGEWRAAAGKLRAANAQRARALAAAPPDRAQHRNKKIKVIEKEIEKRRAKHADAKLKALKARSEYLLCLEAANTTIHKYFVDDLSDLIDCMDIGFHNCISRALRMQASADEGRARALQQSADALYACIDALDSRLDKQKFLEAHHQAFMIPRKLSYQGQPPDEEDAENGAEITNGSADPNIDDSVFDAASATPDAAEMQLKAEMESRLAQLEGRVRALRTESAEACKTLETAEATLLQMVDSEDWDSSHLFGEGGGGAASPAEPGPPEQVAIKARADRHETEEFYLSKFREYLLGSGRIARLESKAAFLRGKVGSGLPTTNPPATPTACIPRHRRRLGRAGSCGAPPRLFAAPLEEHLEATRRELPLVVTSCIRVINLYGLQHQGIFRVSGSQVEIGTLREYFERGCDPLAKVSDASDINSVAGLLKLYLRELRPPLIPIIYFDHLVELAQLESRTEFVRKMQDFVVGLPRSAMVLLRYLFAFLNHLSEFSEENMMDPWNLAICFGPTLVPVPEDKDQVQYQNQVNDLIKNIIILHEDIFPRDDGPMYEKYQTPEQEIGECQQEITQDDVDSEASLYPSEDEGTGSAPSPSPALAAWEWAAREREQVNVRAGDRLLVLRTPRPGWCFVRCLRTGDEGLLPDSCVVGSRDEEYGSLLRDTSSLDDSLRTNSSQRSMSGGGDNHLSQADPGTDPQGSSHIWPKSETGTPGAEDSEVFGDVGPKRTHIKSQSVGDTAVPFSLNREIWQQRATSQLKHTPDLVMDLPAKAASASAIDEPSLGSNEEGPPATSPTTAAERFAQNQHNTLKKRPAVGDTSDKESQELCERSSRLVEESSSQVISKSNLDGQPVAQTGSESTTKNHIETSPVPPRNTRRVAAKFADLTLTGGSLKPQVAAKPAVLLKKQGPIPGVLGKAVNIPITPALPIISANTSAEGNSQ